MYIIQPETARKAQGSANVERNIKNRNVTHAVSDISVTQTANRVSVS